MRVSQSSLRALDSLDAGERQEFEKWAMDYVSHLPDWDSPQGKKVARDIIQKSRFEHRQSKSAHHSGFVPDYVLEEIVQRSQDPVARENARRTLESLKGNEIQWKDINELRAARDTFERVYFEGEPAKNLTSREKSWLEKIAEWLKGIFGSKKSPQPKEDGKSDRFVYSAENSSSLRKTLKRQEGGVATGDKDVDIAYDYAGSLLKFLKGTLGRNSLDNRGMDLHQTVHYGSNYNNAFWNGSEMAYGDGDGKIFGHFAQDPTVIHHELGHGVVQHHNKNGGLIYRGESGALNESFADINAVVLLHEMAQVDMSQSSRKLWLIGAGCMVPYKDSKTGEMRYPALRSFLNEKAYESHPDIGTDRQPKNMKDKYTGGSDNGGVHINSGIPNHAFYLAANKIGGKVWETTYKVWYNALADVPSNCTFKQFALATVKVAVQMAKEAGSALKPTDVDLVAQAWLEVGVLSANDKKEIERLKGNLPQRSSQASLKLAS